ncbi:K+/H+ antiporter subunit F [Benzoatithermus flavus]|uniref:K+/H+ antiporter subunit F n=1 Tax=Benzoatithermus flavus TaxID=3108223 RepID=A0ABU8XQ62_9PROT
MIEATLAIAFSVTALAFLLNLYRLAAGPDVLDRVLALDTLVVDAIALVVLLGMALGTAVLFEAALVMAMLGFVSTVAFCKYLLRGNVIE